MKEFIASIKESIIWMKHIHPDCYESIIKLCDEQLEKTCAQLKE